MSKVRRFGHLSTRDGWERDYHADGDCVDVTEFQIIADVLRALVAAAAEMDVGLYNEFANSDRDGPYTEHPAIAAARSVLERAP